MPLVDSLLTAIVRSDGDALVLHVGEKPYVVAAAGPVELSRQGLGLGAMEGLLTQLLSADALRGLREMGAVEHELASIPAAGHDRFTVIAARGGDDIWIEVRRHRRPRPAVVAEPVPAVAMETPVAVEAPVEIAAPVEVASLPAEMPVAPDAAEPEPLAEPLVEEAPPAAAAHEASPHAETEVVAPVAASAEEEDSTTSIEVAPVAAQPVASDAAEAPAMSAGEPIAVIDEREMPVVDEPMAAIADDIEDAPVAETVDAGAPEAWTLDHVPAIDFETAPDEAAAPVMEFTLDVPAAAAPASFDALVPPAETVVEAAPVVADLLAPVPALEPAVDEPEAAAAPLAEPVAADEPAPVVAAAPDVVSAPAPAAEPAEPEPEPEPEPVAAAEAREAPAAAAAQAPVAPEPVEPPVAIEPAVPEFSAPAAASATMASVPLSPEPPIAPPAPPAEPYVPRYDVPAAAASPRAPMPHVDPAVPEPPAYRPLEPQPTLPGLPPTAFDDVTRVDAPVDTLPGVVLSLTRDSARTASQSSRAHGRAGGIERLLRLAAARGASALYLTTQARPAVRVDGDIRLLEGESPLSSGDVEAAVLELAPDGARDKESAEWIRDLQDVGRVRITTFRDYRGPGALLRMISARATSAEQLGLVREIQALAMEPEGLIIVTGPRASGKSTLVSAFVDLINRQRNDYVITLEGQIRLVHESRGSLISQRELRGSAGEIVAAARAALRENPDVLIIEDLRSPDVLQVALDAAGSGLLVFASVTAPSATAALERLVDLCPSEQRRNARAALAEHLRGVVAQVLLRKAGGGRLAARELVLNTNAVAALVSDGQIAQLPRAIDSGRKLGMAPLNDALVAFVQSGAVDVREAYRKADDKVGLLGLLRREGIDTSFVERLA